MNTAPFNENENENQNQNNNDNNENSNTNNTSFTDNNLDDIDLDELMDFEKKSQASNKTLAQEDIGLF